MRTGRSLLLVGLLTAGLLSVSAGWVGSSAPDGLERVAQDQGFSERAASPPVQVLPDYSVPGIASGRVSTAIAGIVGVVAVLALTIGIGRLLRARGGAKPSARHVGDGS